MASVSCQDLERRDGAEPNGCGEPRLGSADAIVDQREARRQPSAWMIDGDVDEDDDPAARKLAVKPRGASPMRKSEPAPKPCRRTIVAGSPPPRHRRLHLPHNRREHSSLQTKFDPSIVTDLDVCGPRRASLMPTTTAPPQHP